MTPGGQTTSSDGAPLLRDRLVALGKAGSAIGSVALVVQVALAYQVEGYSEPWGAQTAVVAGGAAAPLLLWWCAATRDLAPPALRAVELVALLSTSALYSSFLLFASAQHHFERLALLGLTLVVMLRTALVPDTVRRTVILTAALGLPLMVATYLSYRRFQPDPTDPLSLAETPLAMTAWTAIWWSSTVGVCAAVSIIIFGLRKQVRRALQLGQYTLGERLGAGGMGVVYRAQHAMLRRPTAVKLLLPGTATERSLARFEREVQLTALLTHPNTVTVFDFGRTPEGVFYYAMELLDGAALDDVVAVGGPMPPGRVLSILSMVAGSLSEAHGIGLIHRDIKPANIILCAHAGRLDVAKVVDFGLVKPIEEEVGEREGEPGGDVALSRTNQLVGTPLYMAPELIEAAQNASPSSDLYALGAVGYFLLTGNHVFDGESLVEVCRQHLDDEPQPPSQRAPAAVPEQLETLILGCLEKDPARRPQSALVLLERLAGCAGIDGWTQLDASAFWQEHGPAIAARRAAAQGSVELDEIGTIVPRERDAVDLTHAEASRTAAGDG